MLLKDKYIFSLFTFILCRKVFRIILVKDNPANCFYTIFEKTVFFPLKNKNVLILKFDSKYKML